MKRWEKILLSLLLTLTLFLFVSYFMAIAAVAQFGKSGRAVSEIKLLTFCDEVGEESIGFYRLYVYSSRRNKPGYLTGTYAADGSNYTPTGNISLGFCSNVTCPSDTIINNITVLTDSTGMTSVDVLNTFSDTTFLTEITQGDIIIVDSINACGDRALSFYDGNSWSTPFVGMQAENHGGIAYVATTGDDNKNVIGNSHWPSLTWIDARDDVVASPGTNVVKVFPGVYDLSTSPRLGLLDTDVHYDLSAGVTLTNNSNIPVNALLGASDFGGTGSSSIHHTSYTGQGRFESNASTTALKVFGGFYDPLEIVKFDAQEVFVDGFDYWAFQVASIESNISVDKIRGRSLIYSSTSFDSAIKYNRYFKSDLILVENNDARGGAIRMQPSAGYLPGTTDIAEVGSIYTDNQSSQGFAFYFLNAVESTGGNFNVHFKNIRNERTNTTVYPDYQQSSNASVSNGELFFAGSGAKNINSVITAKAENVVTPIPLVAVHGILLDSSKMVIEVENGRTTGCTALAMMDPHLDRHSYMYVGGDFTTEEPTSPAAMLSCINVDSTSQIIYRNCVFRTSAPGKSPVQITQLNRSNTLTFDNCKFINTIDKTVPPLSTDSNQKLSYRFINCYSNTVGVDTNIIEMAMPIIRDSSLNGTGPGGFRELTTLDGSQRIALYDEAGGNKFIRLDSMKSFVGETGGSNENIYNTSDTLTDDRQLTGDGHELVYKFGNGLVDFLTTWFPDKFEREFNNGNVISKLFHNAIAWQISSQVIGSNKQNLIYNGPTFSNMRNVDFFEGGNSEVRTDSNSVAINITGSRDLTINDNPGELHQYLQSFGDDNAPDWEHLKMRLLTDATEPPSPESGEFYYNTDHQTIEVWDLTKWVRFSSTVGQSTAVYNGVTTQDINAGSDWNTIVLDSIEFDDLNSDITISPTGITINTAGSYRFNAISHVTSAGVRATTQYRVSPVKTIICDTSVRNTTGLNSDADCGSIIIKANAGDFYSLESRRKGDITTPVYAESVGAIRFEITRL